MTTIKDVKGMIMTEKDMRQCDVSVRFTSDEIGETISLQVGNSMIVVAFEEVQKMINQIRNIKEKQS